MSETIPTDPEELERWTFQQIGKFVYWFSRVEFGLRFSLSDVFELPVEFWDLVTAPYDFSKLCDVTLAACELKHAEVGLITEMELRKIRQLIKRCRDINTTRNRIVHGVWAGADFRYHAVHFSREKFEPKEYFGDLGELARAADECLQLAGEVAAFPGGSLQKKLRDQAT